jgi:hypothetical protein
MPETITLVGTGGIIEGNLGTSNVNVNLDATYYFDGTNDYVYAGDDSTNLRPSTAITMRCRRYFLASRSRSV